MWVAGGEVWEETVSSLIDAGKSVVAMVRTEEAKKDLESLGATAIIGTRSRTRTWRTPCGAATRP